MKKVITRAVFVFALLLTLGAVFGGANSASARAATTPATHMIITPAMIRGSKHVSVQAIPALAPATHMITAHAISPKNTPPLIPLQRDWNCNSNIDTFDIFTDFNANLDCFAGLGYLGVTLNNASLMCTYDNVHGNVVWYNPNTNITWTVSFGGVESGCWWLAGGPNNYANFVYSITIYPS